METAAAGTPSEQNCWASMKNSSCAK